MNDETTASEAAEALSEKGIDVDEDELRSLARRNKVTARKVEGEWRISPEAVAPQITRERRERDGEDLDSRLDEAQERGREKGERDSGESIDRIFSDSIDR
jgi:hypothetical protein